MEVDPLCFEVVWQVEAQEILCEWKEEILKQILRNSRGYFSVSPDIEFEERLAIQGNDSKHTSKSTMKYLQERRLKVWNGQYSPHLEYY